MTNRREFLQISAAFSLLPFAGRAFADASSTMARTRFYKAIYDERFAHCRTFAQEAMKYGVPVNAIQGDIADLWDKDLRHCWDNGPAVIAGLTLEPAAFCLKVFGQDAGYRQVFHGDHIARGCERVDHVFSSPAYMLREAESLSDSGCAWGIKVAQLVFQFDERQTRTRTWAVSTSPGAVPDGAEHLVSWIIAPRRNSFRIPKELP